MQKQTENDLFRMEELIIDILVYFLHFKVTIAYSLSGPRRLLFYPIKD